MKQSHIEVTERIIEKSRPTRAAYLQRIDDIVNRAVLTWHTRSRQCRLMISCVL